MQSFLLDTCAVLWLANGEMGRFSSGAVKALRAADALHISPMTEWEIALKWRDGGIDLPMPPRELMARFREHFGVSVAPLTEEVMFRAAELPQIVSAKVSLWLDLGGRNALGPVQRGL